MDDVAPQIGRAFQHAQIIRAAERSELVPTEQRIGGMLDGIVDAVDARAPRRVDEAQDTLGHHFQPVMQGVGAVAQMAEQRLVSRQMLGHRQGGEDGGDERRRAAQPLAHQAQGLDLLGQHPLRGIERAQRFPIGRRLHRQISSLARALDMAFPLVAHAPIDDGITAGGSDLYQVPVVVGLPFQMGGRQRFGLLIVTRPMPPQGHRQPIDRFAGDGRFKSLAFVHCLSLSLLITVVFGDYSTTIGPNINLSPIKLPSASAMCRRRLLTIS